MKAVGAHKFRQIEVGIMTRRGAFVRGQVLQHQFSDGLALPLSERQVRYIQKGLVIPPVEWAGLQDDYRTKFIKRQIRVI